MRMSGINASRFVFEDIDCNCVSHVTFSKTSDITLPDNIYLGFTAHTGEVTGNCGRACVVLP